jgi:Leucine-rich repeat (LRR) protein
LEWLYCSNNQLSKLEGLPQGLKELYCSDNQLTKLEGLPQGLEGLKCSNNQLKTLEGLPKGLKALYCFGNPLVFVEPITQRPKHYVVPTNLDFLHSELNYPKYYKNYVTFTTNFYTLKTLLLLELGYLSLEVFENIKIHYHSSLKPEI